LAQLAAARRLAAERKERGEVPATVKYRQQFADGSYTAKDRIPSARKRRGR